MTRPIIFYHKDCSDGFGSAWAAWKHFGENADYRALSNGEPTPIEELRGRNAYFLDIAPKPESRDESFNVAQSIAIIDHHATNRETASLAKEGTFDITHSGSVLTWRFFHPAVPTPSLLLFIEDMDLWKFSLPETKNISMSLSLIPKDFNEWDKYAEILQNASGIESESEKGKSLLKFSDNEVATVAKEAELVNFEGMNVFMVNAPSIFASVLGHELAKKRGPLALVWSRKGGQYKVSLRGDGTVDVSLLAQKYGGGGHKSAAAFVMKDAEWSEFIGKIVEKK